MYRGKKQVGWILCIAMMAIVFVCALLFFNPRQIEGDSMLPTYKHGETIFVNKMNKNFSIGDVVVFHYGDLVLVKRIFALSGDVVKIEAQAIYRNDVLIHTFKQEAEDISIIIKHDEYFVLGDNLENSMDSRYFGCIKKNNTIGKVWS